MSRSVCPRGQVMVRFSTRQAHGDLKTGLDPGADDFAVALAGHGHPPDRTAHRGQRPGTRRWRRGQGGGNPCCRHVRHWSRSRSPAPWRVPRQGSRSSVPSAGSGHSRARSCSVTVPALASIAQVARVRGGRWVTKSGSTTFSASAARVQPVARMGCMARISTSQTVTRLRARHGNRAVHRVGSGGHLDPVPVPAIGVDGLGGHGIAAGHGQRGGPGAKACGDRWSGSRICCAMSQSANDLMSAAQSRAKRGLWQGTRIAAGWGLSRLRIPV